MTSFVDGPARGQKLILRHAPLYLRVVCSGGGACEVWDALDLLSDEPAENEKIFAYRSVGGVIRGHLQTMKKGGGRGGIWFEGSSYVLVEPQPTDKAMRDSDAWREWCQQQPVIQ